MTTNINEVILETTRGWHKAGAINNRQMKKFETLCKAEPKTKKPTLKKLAPKEIKKIRLRVNLKLEKFAECLNVTPKKIKDWETGKVRPSGIALKLLSLVDKKGLKVLDC